MVWKIWFIGIFKFLVLLWLILIINWGLLVWKVLNILVKVGFWLVVFRIFFIVFIMVFSLLFICKFCNWKLNLLNCFKFFIGGGLMGMILVLGIWENLLNI